MRKGFLMRKLVAFLTILVLCVGMMNGCLANEGEGKLGRLAKLGVDEDTLNEVIREIYFSRIPFSGYLYFDSLNNMIDALNAGVIAGLEVDEYTARYILSRSDGFALFAYPADLAEEISYAMLLRGEDRGLCDRISAVIAEMKADGTLESMKKQYIDDVIAGAEPETVSPEHFEGAETIRAALTGDRPPMDYFSAAGEPVGFNTALMAEIGKRLGVNVELIPVDSGARSISLASKTSDVIFWTEVADFENWDGANREDQPDDTIPTEPYLSVGYELIVLPENNQ